MTSTPGDFVILPKRNFKMTEENGDAGAAAMEALDANGFDIMGSVNGFATALLLTFAQYVIHNPEVALLNTSPNEFTKRFLVSQMGFTPDSAIEMTADADRYMEAYIQMRDQMEAEEVKEQFIHAQVDALVEHIVFQSLRNAIAGMLKEEGQEGHND